MNTRRSFLRNASIAFGGTTLLPVASASASSRITLTVEETNGGSVDYQITITGTDARAEYDTESEESVNVDYDRNLTYIYGTVQNDKDVFSYPATEHISYVKGDGSFISYQPDVEITTDATEGVADWDLLEVYGYDWNDMNYAISATDGIREYANLESDDYVYDGTASGVISDGGEDDWEMSGNFTRIHLRPVDGTISVNWRNLE